MSHSKYDSYSRRALLSRLGGGAAVAALTPFLPYTEAEAAVSAKPRYMYMFSPVAPSSAVMNKVLPVTNQGENTNLSFRGDYTALNTMADKMSLYRGMYNKAGDNSNLGGGHRGRCFTFLTGAPIKAGQVGAGSQIEGNNGNNESSSIDQYMADQLIAQGTRTPIKDLRFGWGIKQVDSMDTASFRNGKKMFYDNSAKKVFDRMFNAGGSSGAEGPDLTYRKNILDAVYKDLGRVKNQLSSLDARRLDQHLEAVNDIQAEIIRNEDSAGGAACSIPGALANATGYQDQSKAFAQLVAVAFNCDLTRVVGSMYGHPYDTVNAHQLTTRANKVSNWHQATHGLGGSQADISNFISSVLKYRADVYLEVLKQLDAFDEPTGGTLLDNSIVHWFTECISDHKYQDCFNLIGGGAGYFKMGKQMIVGGTTNKNDNAPLNMLHASIGRAMGFNLNKFGNYTGVIAGKYLA